MLCQKRFNLSDEAQMETWGQAFASHLSSGLTLYLQGQLGAGKTTLTRSILRGLGYAGRVKSPTYTLIEPYTLPAFTFIHMDLYRLEQAEELAYVGIEEYFNQSSICVIEWAEKGFPLLPPSDLNCYIDFMGEGRTLTIEAFSERGEKIMGQL